VPTPPPSRRAALLTLGCARNEVDSEELAGRLAAGGWDVTDDGEGADVIVVNTCGFVESAKKDSVDVLLDAAETGAKVVAVGCMAERYGAELAENLPEAAAVLGFDHYPHLGERLDDVVAGRATPPRTGARCCRSPRSSASPPTCPSPATAGARACCASGSTTPRSPR
jgi:ribosomal protein S12 methylthiotransferase